MLRSFGPGLILACILLIGGCQDPSENCNPSPCAKYRYEVVFADSLSHEIDSVGTTGLSIQFNPIIPDKRSAAKSESDCLGCTSFILTDSAVLTADRPIISPVGDTVPAGSNLLDPPWNGMLGAGELFFRFHQGVRFESGTYGFSMKAPWVFEGIRTILTDTSYIQLP